MDRAASGRFVLDVAKESLRLSYRHLRTWLAIAFASSFATEILLGPATGPLTWLAGLVIGLAANALITRLAVNDLLGRQETATGTVRELIAATLRFIGATIVLAIGAGLVLGLAFFVAVIVLVSWLGPSPFAVDSVPERLPANVEVGVLVGGAVLLSIVIARFVALTPVVLERRGGPFALLTLIWSLSRGYWLALTALIASAFIVVDSLDLLAAPIGPAWRIVSALPSTMVSAAYGAVFYVRVLERDQQPIHEALPTLAT